MTPKQYKLHLLNHKAILGLLKDGAKLSTNINIDYSDPTESIHRQDASNRFPELTVDTYIDSICDALEKKLFAHFALIQRPQLCEAIPEYYDLGHTGPLPKICDDGHTEFYLFINLIPDAAELLVKRHDLELWA